MVVFEDTEQGAGVGVPEAHGAVARSRDDVLGGDGESVDGGAMAAEDVTAGEGGKEVGPDGAVYRH